MIAAPIDRRYDAMYVVVSTVNRKDMPADTPLLLGTLDLLILKALSLQALHGLGVARRLEQITSGAYSIGPGSLFPALHRLEQNGWLSSYAGNSENNRRAKFYKLTAAGRRQLASEMAEWKRIVGVMHAALASS
jgi:PadR family transcriptional regulator, regulatory protein PadR